MELEAYSTDQCADLYRKMGAILDKVGIVPPQQLIRTVPGGDLTVVRGAGLRRPPNSQLYERYVYIEELTGDGPVIMVHQGNRKPNRHDEFPTKRILVFNRNGAMSLSLLGRLLWGRHMTKDEGERLHGAVSMMQCPSREFGVPRKIVRA